jgi:5-methylcytosine-specific restriction endonuclease McrA
MSWTKGRPGTTRASRALAAQTIAAWPTCYLNYNGCTTVSTQADHVIPHFEHGTNTPDNMRGACHHCHQTKTKTEAARARQHLTTKRPTERHPGLR